MPLLTGLPVTVGRYEYVEHLASVLAGAFNRDALTRADILYQDGAPNDTIISPERWLQFWISNIKNKINAGGQIAEAGNWAAAALWFPPGVKRPPLGNLDELPLPIREYLDKFENIKQKYFGNRSYWYLNVIGRNPDRRDPGAVSALIRPYLRRAQEGDLPIFLEASSSHSRDIYLHFGFRVVEEVLVGEGCIDEEGNIVDGGKGATLYGMIAEPRV